MATRNVPQTSREAYAKKVTVFDKEAIVGLLAKEPNKNFTYKEIAQYLGWWTDPNRASRRLSELVRMKKIVIDGVRKCFYANSNCTAYKIAI